MGNLIKLFDGMGGKHPARELFHDFVEFMALSISATSDVVHTEARGKQLVQLLVKYTTEERKTLAEMVRVFGDIVTMEFETEGPRDVLGEVFECLGLGNARSGQFFTPWSICEMVAGIVRPGDLNEDGYAAVLEPACGAGGMLLAYAKALNLAGHDCRTDMVALAVDIDMTCVYMTFVQLSLFGIPAVVLHGDTLAMQEWSRWYTPVYLLDKWVWRFACNLSDRRNEDDERLKMATEPTYAAIRWLEAIEWEERKQKQKFTVDFATEPDGQMMLI